MSTPGDLLLIDERCLYSTNGLSDHQLLVLSLILMVARQFHLAAKLLEDRNQLWSDR